MKNYLLFIYLVVSGAFIHKAYSQPTKQLMVNVPSYIIGCVDAHINMAKTKGDVINNQNVQILFMICDKIARKNLAIPKSDKK